MNIFKAPSHSYTEFLDISNYNNTWSMSIYIMITLFFLSIFYYPIDFQSFILYSFGFLISLLGLFVIYLTRNYIKATIILVLFGLVLVYYSIFFLNVKSDVLEVEWLLVLLVFTFFKLGKLAGILLIGIEISLFSLYIFVYYRGDISIVNYSTPLLIGFIIEFSFPMFILVYYVHLSVHSNNVSEQNLRSAHTILQEQYAKIKDQNEEKTVLLKEIHHRVKNNLQVITSLLRLQSSDLNQNNVNIHFDDAINRIMTMSLIHQKMYQKENLALIDIKDYFNTLINDLIKSLSVNVPVHLTINSEIDFIGSKSFVPLALIISELVSNSMKYAFKEEGSITIDFIKKKQTINLIYFDNGSWKSQVNSKSFGIQLVETLCKQLGGVYSQKIESTGTTFSCHI